MLHYVWETQLKSLQNHIRQIHRFHHELSEKFKQSIFMVQVTKRVEEKVGEELSSLYLNIEGNW